MSSNAGKKVICFCTVCKGCWVSKFVHRKHVDLKYYRTCEPPNNTTTGQLLGETEDESEDLGKDEGVSEHGELALEEAQSCSVIDESSDVLQLDVADTCDDFHRDFNTDKVNIRGHLQTDFVMLNVIMTLRGGV